MHPRILLLLAACALTLVACSGSDSSTVQGTRSVAAPVAGIAPAATTAPALRPPPIPAAPQVNARGYYLMDFTSGQVLAEINADQRLEPASLTKLMSAYAVFHALKDGRIKMDDQVRVSAHARDQDGSRMFIEVGTVVSVENLVQGMIVQSGNDATVALAEHVAGSEPVFVDLMNQYAQRLGLASTHFQNSPGMPSPEHYTTARDIAVLSAALIRDYPEYYKYYSQRSFTWNKITQPNRNGLLERDPTVDGLKTGHTDTAGYCLVSSAKRGDMRLVSVVMGSPNISAREDASAALLNYGFNFYQSRKLYDANATVLTIPVWKGTADTVKLGVPHDVYAIVPRGQDSALAAAADVPEPLFAPLARNIEVGKLRVSLGDKTIGTYALHPIEDVSEAGFFSRMIDDVKLWMH
ncbi:MAG TPA: D-alanyl-D-alanine carboxypeptidase family protein [Steroidobacteraceae bacterium]|jgi:serine-type D-Ala-D-Ala carboxypeptidase (penicillin-binding protein 5/6)|nr:D-alanyl-D-alanine carboxypeptidase family protein [Steroidobacteraceae bacterium]